MATWRQQQETAAKRVEHLPHDEIHCRHCGEESASGVWKGYAHFYGPRAGHAFMARRPETAQ